MSRIQNVATSPSPTERNVRSIGPVSDASRSGTSSSVVWRRSATPRSASSSPISGSCSRSAAIRGSWSSRSRTLSTIDGTANTSIATTIASKPTTTAPTAAPRPSGVWSMSHPTSGSSAIANTMPMMIHAGTGARSITSAMATTTITTIDVAIAADRDVEVAPAATPLATPETVAAAPASIGRLRLGRAMTGTERGERRHRGGHQEDRHERAGQPTELESHHERDGESERARCAGRWTGCPTSRRGGRRTSWRRRSRPASTTTPVAFGQPSSDASTTIGA